MTTDASEQFGGLEAEAFARLVARTWRDYGWEVIEPTPDELPAGTDDVAEPVTGGVALLARAAERRVVLAAPGAAGALSAATMLGVLSAAAAADDLLVVSAVGYETGALSVADAYGIDVVGPEALARLAGSTDERSRADR